VESPILWYVAFVLVILAHTQTGVEEELGVIPCAVDGVFDAINAVSSPQLESLPWLITQDPERAFLLRVSYIEIYNETLRDLLNFKKGALKDEEKPNIHFNKVSRPLAVMKRC
jgi:centromeric protein E